MRITRLTGDVTRPHVDAVASSPSPALLPGGGVGAAIRRRGGSSVASARALSSVPGQ